MLYFYSFKTITIRMLNKLFNLKKRQLLLLNWISKCSIFILPLVGFSQELPPIIKFSPSTYKAANQNWMIAQNKQNVMFFANNDGLLEFNGSEWTLYPSPNESIIRSVKVIDDKIYSGCYMEFGYWKRKSDGLLEYISLSEKVKSKILDDEQFWNILQFDHWVIFQSLNQIFTYDTKNETFKTIKPKSGVFKAYAVAKSIYFQTIKDGLFEIENGSSKLISNDPFFTNNKIVSIYKRNDGLLMLTQHDGFYEFKENKLSKWITDADIELKNSSVYCAHQYDNSSYVIGTVSNGIFIINLEGKTDYHITQSKGISNNTALSLFEDADKNIWIGLDNGINCVNLTSPIRSYYDDSGKLGTVYASTIHKDKLYVGTNQGLFYKNKDGIDTFKFILGTKGQVWSLFSYDDLLFCGHDSGTFLVENQTATSIYNASGTWKFEPSPLNKNILLQGNYSGISVLEKTNNTWQFKNKIKGFDYSSKYFEFSTSNEIIISHEYKGIFRIKTDPSYSKVTLFEAHENPKKGKNASIANFNNTIYYASKEGIFAFSNKDKRFEQSEKLSSIFQKDEYLSGKLMSDESNRLWFFSKNYINYFSYGKLSSTLKHNVIPIPSSLTNSMLGYENISQLSESLYLVGTTDGYYTISIDDLLFNNNHLYITNISTNKQNQLSTFESMEEEGNFKSNNNNITFSYTVPKYNKYIIAEFQYKLEGFQNEWSQWSSKSTVNFKNLRPGNYTFIVRSKIGNSISENSEKYSFTILKPWYATNLALIIYILLLLILAYFINKAYQKYYFKQQEKLIDENNRLLEIKELETEQELMRIKNQQLEQDFESKNRELAASTMNLIKKNELLSMIKEDLKNTTETLPNKSLKSLITNINKNINEEDSWNVFVDAFNNADKDFLKKIKIAHQSLTPNDLRLCAFLRLNLSSKEIAPLLNISVRSVEIKRYRLRKKMDLSHEQGLVEYILSI
ncbi:regulatory LuxR family protein [Flavobacterium lacus]|uniref:Regulatory LuxR family protein n=2 Tax=Flavobacterium lacus TaxID=1353778 RepID=A0A328WRT5_9FLAO|nr:regulatory LuxR family protein [Flavobacterium lacus]